MLDIQGSQKANVKKVQRSPGRNKQNKYTAYIYKVNKTKYIREIYIQQNGEMEREKRENRQ